MFFMETRSKSSHKAQAQLTMQLNLRLVYKCIKYAQQIRKIN